MTDHKFTGQKLDGTGLQYYQSRYYDPAIGTFISPDTIVPDATNVFDYNRYMMARGNPLRFTDRTGHFSEEQLIASYGESWRTLFSDEWINLLLDHPNSQVLGAQLGDLVVMGRGNSSIKGVVVLDTEGQLALWDVDNKTPIDVMAMGRATFDSLSLYRIAGGETGSEGMLYGDLMGDTQYLSGVNGPGTGPYTMKAVGEYSTNAQNSPLSLAGDWFMGRGGQGYYVQNSMTFQGFNFGNLISIMGSGGTTMGAADLAQTFIKGQKPTGLGLWGTVTSVATMIYGSMM